MRPSLILALILTACAGDGADSGQDANLTAPEVSTDPAGQAQSDTAGQDATAQQVAARQQSSGEGDGQSSSGEGDSSGDQAGEVSLALCVVRRRASPPPTGLIHRS